MTDKNYDLYYIEKDLIEELEDNQVGILKNNGDNIHEIVDSNISVYTYDQIMIYANNSELWHMTSGLGGPYDGYEGSLEDLINEYDDMCKEDQEYVDNIKKQSEAAND